MSDSRPAGAPASPADWIVPDWPAPANVRACSTTRTGGVSVAPYDSFNLADHVGDDPERVQDNRRRLAEILSLPSAPTWLHQVHGQRIVDAVRGAGQEGDGSVTSRPGVVCAVLTADCLPVLLCDRAGRRIAAAHAGWRGLAGGVIEAAVDALDTAPGELLAWLGPAIGPAAFEVGAEVRAAFLRYDPQAAAAFVPGAQGRWFADLYSLARQRLAARGVGTVHGGRWCTFNQSDRFYSYRRERITGRMATLLWLAAERPRA